MDEKKEAQSKRIFEQLPDAISFFSDFAQIINTGKEIVIQFYETIPGLPGPEGHILGVKTRLRATITIGLEHAKIIGNLLLTGKTEGK